MPHFSLSKEAPYSPDIWRQAVRVITKIPLGTIHSTVPGSKGDLWAAADITARRIHDRIQAEAGHPDPLPLELAVLFHEAYERLAPEFGYETRVETREFDPETPNGGLMVAVCRAILNQQKAALS